VSRAFTCYARGALPVRNFTWNDLPKLLDFVEVARAEGDYGRELRRRVFQESLAQPGLAPQDNCFLLEEEGQVQGFCHIWPELAIGRAVLELEAASHLTGSQMERQLVQRAVARSRELRVRVAHVCLPDSSPRGMVLEAEGFSRSRIYWEMAWRRKVLPQVPLPDGFSIRHLQPGDVQALTDTQNAAFAGSWGFCPNTVEQIQYRSSMSNTRPQGILFLYHGPQIAGYCWTSIAPAHDQTKGIISMIGIVPGYRGRGVSRPILLAGMEYLRSIGVADISLRVDESNTPAIRLYTSMGFEKVEELQWFQFRLPVG
jgi:mycothiol synthase